MSKNCKICGTPTIFYIWSTSRNFNMVKFVDTLKSKNKTNSKISLSIDGEPVCQVCVEKYKLLS